MTGSIFRRRRIGLLAALLSVLALPALAAPVETPEAFVRRVYARYGNGGPGVTLARPDGTPFYAAGLLDLVARDAAGGTGSIDWNPVCDCQDYENLRVRSVTTTEHQGGTVDARVVFRNLKADHRVVLTLSQTPTGWRIGDVSSEGTKSIVSLLRKALAPPGRPVRPKGGDRSPAKL